MVDRKLFPTGRVAFIPKADVVNEAGGTAFAFTPQHALAQYAATGCLSGTYYATAEEQLETVLKLALECDALFVAKTAVYARETGFMKDIPAVLCAVLFFRREHVLLERIFNRVITTGKMLSNFVQIVRSGQTGRKSFGTVGLRLIRRWLSERDGDALYRASIGITPTLSNIVAMVHPTPHSPEVDGLYAYLLNKTKETGTLPGTVRALEAWKKDRRLPVPDVSFQVLSSLDLSDDDWKAIARQATWTQTRMNLNTFMRHHVFEDAEITHQIAMRLRNETQIQRAHVFPYQIFSAYLNVDTSIPYEIREALHDAMEVATRNVPSFGDKSVVVCPDISGSMDSPVTGARGTATSKVKCVDIAALITACVVRQNPRATVLPFNDHVERIKIEPRDSVMTIAKGITAACGGGTACSAPLQWLNERDKLPVDVVLIVSDNQSWRDVSSESTRTMIEWARLRTRNPAAKLVCIDIQPYSHTQAQDRADILNIGGFSDSVFEVVSRFVEAGTNAEHWTEVISSAEI